jgi:ribosomal-protein-alanine N-acetyltransferase
MNPLTIRNMTEDDMETVAKLEQQLFSDAWSVSMLKDCFTYSQYWCLVALEDEEIKGYLITQIVCGEGELHRIGVRPDARRRGIADALMEQLNNKGKKDQLYQWFLEVRESNESAIALYKKWGFERLDLRKNYYHNPTENALIMKLLV